MELLTQLQQLHLVNWKKNSKDNREVKFENQFKKFVALLSRTTKCVVPKWPGDPSCRRRRT